MACVDAWLDLTEAAINRERRTHLTTHVLEAAHRGIHALAIEIDRLIAWIGDQHRGLVGSWHDDRGGGRQAGIGKRRILAARDRLDDRWLRLAETVERDEAELLAGGRADEGEFATDGNLVRGAINVDAVHDAVRRGIEDDNLIRQRIGREAPPP